MSVKFITRSEVTESVTDIVNSSMLKSDKIRTLYSLQIPKVQIAELLQIRYQHVRNVLLNPPKKK